MRTRAVQSLPQVEVHGARGGKPGIHQGLARGGKERLVLFQELLRDTDLSIGYLFFGQRDGPVVLARIPQMGAIQGATDSHFAFRAAAKGADFTVHPGTETARAANLADGTNHSFSIKGGESRPMRHTHFFFKLEVEHNADEKPERLGEEIRHQLLKLYGVRAAELANYTVREE